MAGITAVITQEEAKISCNFEQVEQAIQEKLSGYQDAVFTEGSKAYAKKEVASLRAEKKSLQENMKAAKKQYMAPWDAFEAQAKRLIGLYDGPIGLINGQVKAFEEKRVAEKKQAVSKIYLSVPEGIRPYIPLERIYNPKWENATCKEKDIVKEIEGLAGRVREDLETIQAMDSDAAGKALEVYRSGLSLPEAVAYINNYERQKREILAREQEKKRAEEAERIRQEERGKMLAEQQAREALEAAVQKAEQEKQEALRLAGQEKEEALRLAKQEKQEAVELARVESAREAMESLIPDMDGEEGLYEYRVSLSADAKAKLEMYMDSVGIEWEMV